MRRFQWLAVTAGIAALAACSGADEADINVEMNEAENLALPPADMNTDMNADMNAGMNADMNMDTNATENAAANTADNSTNAY